MVKQIVFILITLSLINLIYCVKIPAVRCGGNVEEVHAFGCVNDTEPCVVKRGTTGRLEVVFIAPFNARFVRADARAKVDSGFSTFYMPWFGMHRNACEGHGLQCPIMRNQRYKYTYDVVVERDYPPFKTEYTWKLTNFWGSVISCFNMNIEVL